jgi:hypothetical protein
MLFKVKQGILTPAGERRFQIRFIDVLKIKMKQLESVTKQIVSKKFKLYKTRPELTVFTLAKQGLRLGF